MKSTHDIYKPNYVLVEARMESDLDKKHLERQRVEQINETGKKLERRESKKEKLRIRKAKKKERERKEHDLKVSKALVVQRYVRSFIESKKPRIEWF